LDYTLDSLYILLMNQLLNLNSNIFIYIIFLYYYINKKSIKLYFYLLIIYIIIHNLNDFLIINYINNENYYSINLNLLNGLFIIHPVFIYLCLINYIIIVIIYNEWLLKYNTNFCINYSIYNYVIFSLIQINRYMYNSIYFILVAIILGSWWAMQELNWGGWWEWDLVEIINLFYLLLLLFFMHQNIIFLLKYFNKFINNMIIIITFILLVRYNLIHSIHNFINSTEFIQFYNYFLFSLAFIIYILTFNLSIFNYRFKIYNLIFCSYKYVCIFIIFIIVYNYLGLDILNILYYFKLFILFYIIIFTFFNVIFNLKLVILKYNFLILFNDLYVLNLLNKIILNIKKLKLLHSFIFIFIFIITLNYINFNYIIENICIFNYYHNLNIVDNILSIVFNYSFFTLSEFNDIMNETYLNYYNFVNNESLNDINLKFISSINNLPTWNDNNLFSYNKYILPYTDIFLYFLILNIIYFINCNIRKIYY